MEAETLNYKLGWPQGPQYTLLEVSVDKSLLFDKTYGCLAGAVMGDSLGAIPEGMHYLAVQRKWGRITGVVPEHVMLSGKNASSDDTAHREILFKTMIRKGGRIDAWDLGQGIRDFMRLNRMAPTELALYQKLVYGCPAHENGHGLFPTGTCGFAAIPIGVLHACDPYEAAKDAYELFSTWVDGVAQEAPMAVAAAVAEAFKPSATRESICDAAIKYCGPRVRPYIERAVEVASKFDDPWEALPTFHEKLALPDDGLMELFQSQSRVGIRSRFPFKHKLEDLDGGGQPEEMPSLGIAFFHIANGDPMKAMFGAASFGRDCDGFAGIAGAITGAWKGTAGFDLEMLAKMDAADKGWMENWEDTPTLAEKMQTPIINTFKEKLETVRALQALR